MSHIGLPRIEVVGGANPTGVGVYVSGASEIFAVNPAASILFDSTGDAAWEKSYTRGAEGLAMLPEEVIGEVRGMGTFWAVDLVTDRETKEMLAPYGGTSPASGFDCSGFTSFAWSATGVVMPTQSRRQINMVAPIDLSTAQAGDLVYYPGHISLYLGIDDTILHAPDYGDVVSFSRRNSVMPCEMFMLTTRV